jgi:hypothetical protein
MHFPFHSVPSFFPANGSRIANEVPVSRHDSVNRVGVKTLSRIANRHGDLTCAPYVAVELAWFNFSLFQRLLAERYRFRQRI